jgi:hypothetical protein
MPKGKIINANTNGFDKNPENINRNGANGRSITKCLKEMLSQKVIEFSIKMKKEDGSVTEKNFKLEAKDDFNHLLAAVAIQKALGGDKAFWSEVMTRCEGSPTQKVEQTVTLSDKLNKIKKISFVDNSIPENEI